MQVSAEFQQVKWDFCDDLIPGGAAAEAPACGGDDSGEAAVGGLGEFHVMKPFPEGVFCGEVHQHVFGRQGGVSCPSVFSRWGQSVGNQKKLEIVAFLVIACSSLAMGSEQEKLPIS